MMTKEQKLQAMHVGKDMKDAEIRALYKSGYSVSEVAELMELRESTIKIIIRDLDVI